VKIPEQGWSREQIFEQLERQRGNDTPWRQGRTWAYVYDPGPEADASQHVDAIAVAPDAVVDRDVDVLVAVKQHARLHAAAARAPGAGAGFVDAPHAERRSAA
jgi:glutamate/tyrosine decarboxylase-like PLP-dependent enzyme